MTEEAPAEQTPDYAAVRVSPASTPASPAKAAAAPAMGAYLSPSPQPPAPAAANATRPAGAEGSPVNIDVLKGWIKLAESKFKRGVPVLKVFMLVLFHLLLFCMFCLI